MPYFSRLTDIVTCNLTAILAEADDPRATLEEVIREMEEGVSGAERCMKTATVSEARLRREIDEQRAQVESWLDKARGFLSGGNEDEARLALMRKHEVENLIAGLEMQFKAATATREHLTTTYPALEARLADARRRLTTLGPGGAQEDDAIVPAAAGRPGPPAKRLHDVIDVELEALKRELKRS